MRRQGIIIGISHLADFGPTAEGLQVMKLLAFSPQKCGNFRILEHPRPIKHDTN